MFFRKKFTCLDCGRKTGKIYSSGLMRGGVCKKCYKSELILKKITPMLHSMFDVNQKKGDFNE